MLIKIVSDAPVAQCQPATVDMGHDGTITVPGTAVDNSSTDDCNSDFSVLTPSDFTCSDIGITQSVTLTVFDASGNSSSCSTTVDLEDNTAPDVACNDVLVELDAAGMGSVTAADFDVEGLIFDGCGIQSVVTDLASLTFDCDDVDLTHSLNSTRVSYTCLLYTSPSPRDATLSRMPSSA